MRLFPFLFVVTLWIPLNSVALHDDTNAAGFEWRNDEFLHSVRDFSKSNAFSENLIPAKFILHEIFFKMSLLSSGKTSWMFFNLQSVPQKTHMEKEKIQKLKRKLFILEKVSADVQIDHHWSLNTHLHDKIYFEKLFST